MVKAEQSNQNKVALAIKSLHLKAQKITLVLNYEDKDYDTEVEISKTAHANATSYFQDRKVAQSKEQKSLVHTSKAVETASKKILQNLSKKTAEVTIITKKRTQNWYEVFNWFPTTENCLVIAGRDPVQNELLLTRYFKDGDKLVATDYEGGTIAVVKPNGGIISDSSLLQAGGYVVCSSKAWANKVSTSAFHLSYSQVKKVVQNQVLGPGLFHIVGEKQWMRASQVVMGVGLLFLCDEGRERHYYDRRPWLRGENVIEVQSGDIDDDGDAINNQDGQEATDLLENTDINEGIDDSQAANEDYSAEEPNIEASNDVEISEGVNDVDNDEEPKDDENSEEPNQNGTEEFENNSASPQTSVTDSQKKGGKLSAKQRKLLKKGKSLDYQSPISAQNTPKTKQSPEVLLKQAHQKQPRGKKGKKKVKDYGFDSDSDDKANTSITKQDPMPDTKVVESPVPKLLPRPKKDPLQVLKEANEFQVPDIDIESLISNPLPEDILQNCIPVCAPWIALQKYKYRLKIIPGSLKRGKAIQQAKQAFLAIATKKMKSKVEQELIDSVPPKDWNDAMISKAKLVINEKK